MQAKLRLHIPQPLWVKLASELHRRTEGRHESGAFILGRKSADGRHASELIYYDELDPGAYDTGVCVLHADVFGVLWQRCRQLGLVVVADAHVHRFGAGQSRADRENPMVARAGHLALIFPEMARPPVNAASLGLYEYLGDHQWRTHSAAPGAEVLNIKEEK